MRLSLSCSMFCMRRSLLRQGRPAICQTRQLQVRASSLPVARREGGLDSLAQKMLGQLLIRRQGTQAGGAQRYAWTFSFKADKRSEMRYVRKRGCGGQIARDSYEGVVSVKKGQCCGRRMFTASGVNGGA